jgi:hypothetical protein
MSDRCKHSLPLKQDNATSQDAEGREEASATLLAAQGRAHALEAALAEAHATVGA